MRDISQCLSRIDPKPGLEVSHPIFRSYVSAFTPLRRDIHYAIPRPQGQAQLTTISGQDPSFNGLPIHSFDIPKHPGPSRNSFNRKAGNGDRFFDEGVHGTVVLFGFIIDQGQEQEQVHERCSRLAQAGPAVTQRRVSTRLSAAGISTPGHDRTNCRVAPYHRFPSTLRQVCDDDSVDMASPLAPVHQHVGVVCDSS